MSTWILLRGLARESRHWGAFPEILRSAMGDAEVVCLDLPGNGRLHRLKSPLRVEEMAEYCRTELRSRGIAPPYNVLALSLGAMVAVAWAAAHPAQIECCVLINTSLRRFSPFHHRLRPGNYPALLKLAFLGDTPGRWEKLIMRLTSNRLEQHEAVLDAWLAYRREDPVSRGNAIRQMFAASRYRAPERKPAVPVLVLASANDALVDPRCSKQLALRWGTEIACHPTAGHDIPLDDGPWVAERVRAWRRT